MIAPALGSESQSPETLTYTWGSSRQETIRMISETMIDTGVGRKTESSL